MAAPTPYLTGGQVRPESYKNHSTEPFNGQAEGQESRGKKQGG